MTTTQTTTTSPIATTGHTTEITTTWTDSCVSTIDWQPGSMGTSGEHDITV